MSSPTTDNKVVDTVDSVIKNAIENVADPMIESTMIIDFPWLNLPVVRQIFHFLLGFLGNYFYQYTAQVTIALIVDMQTKGEASCASVAISQLKTALAVGDVILIQKASDDFDAAMKKLVNWDGEAKI